MARRAPNAAPAVWAQASAPAAAPARARAPATAEARTAALAASEKRADFARHTRSRRRAGVWSSMMLMVTCRYIFRHSLRRPGLAKKGHFRREKQSSCTNFVSRVASHHRKFGHFADATVSAAGELDFRGTRYKVMP